MIGLYRTISVFLVVLGSWLTLVQFLVPGIVCLIVATLTGFAAGHFYKLERKLQQEKAKHVILEKGLKDFRAIIKLSQNGGVVGMVPHGRDLKWERLVEGGYCYKQDNLSIHVPVFSNIQPAFEAIDQPLEWDSGRDTPAERLTTPSKAA